MPIWLGPLPNFISWIPQDSTGMTGFLQESQGHHKDLISKAHRTFGIHCNERIAVHVTICGSKVEEILECGLKVKEYELRHKNFS